MLKSIRKIKERRKTLLFKIENLVLRARSELNGFAGRRGFSVQVSVFCFSFLTPDTRHLKP
jgi:hypothetical protein